MKIWGRTQPLMQYPIRDCLRRIRTLGFEGVEVTFENGDLHPRLLTEALLDDIKALVADLGLAPFSASYHKDYIYSDEHLEDTVISIRAARRLGTGVLVFGGTPKRSGDEAEWDLMVQRTRQLVEVAEEEGVVLAQEFEPGFIVGTTTELLRLFEEIPSPYLAANLDLGHMFLVDPDPVAAIYAVGDKVVHVHIENMPRGKHDHQIPQDGDMDLSVYLKALADVGYDGGLALDLYKYDYEAIAPEAIAYLHSLLTAL